MYEKNPLLHVRTSYGRNRVMISDVARLIERDTTVQKDEMLYVLDLGPGLIPVSIARIKFKEGLESMLKHTPKDYVLGRATNFEAFEIARSLAFRYNVNISAVDNYEPCLISTPPEFSFPYQTNSFGRSRRVVVNTFLHDVRNPFHPKIGEIISPDKLPRAVGHTDVKTVFPTKFKIIYAAFLYDRIPHEDYRGLMTSPNFVSGWIPTLTKDFKLQMPIRQIAAVQNSDALLDKGGYLVVTTGKDSPNWSALLSPTYERMFKEGSIAFAKCGYEIWRKKADEPLPLPRKLFTPPRIEIDKSRSTANQTAIRTVFRHEPDYKLEIIRNELTPEEEEKLRKKEEAKLKDNEN